eukprot:TRINITY_DN15955_c0_g1_i1.p1 TRINITY_DN15955_c0_g1~~TRINITY_DN15955_c0_g1_i1.p1  ORF type:complete len:276 (-),score=-6.11 TRINITY_DN15955_c0_g1_i1:64-891(-)
MNSKTVIYPKSQEFSDKEMQATLKNLNHWEKNAKKYQHKHEVSWKDKYAVQLEIKTIKPLIRKNQKVIDIGCSNGYSTFQICKDKNTELHAIDYSAESIKHAKQRNWGNSFKDVKIDHGNILNIEKPNNDFDIAYTIRTLINLPNWGKQQDAIKEIHRILKPKGRYIVSEAFCGSLKKLNQIRSVENLEPLKMPEFNQYLQEEEFESYINTMFKIKAIKKFSSIYYLGSRFLRCLSQKKYHNSYVNTINKVFYQLEEAEDAGDYGIQKVYVLEKK